jgi:hypothetical protein
MQGTQRAAVLAVTSIILSWIVTSIMPAPATAQDDASLNAAADAVDAATAKVKACCWAAGNPVKMRAALDEVYQAKTAADTKVTQKEAAVAALKPNAADEACYRAALQILRDARKAQKAAGDAAWQKNVRYKRTHPEDTVFQTKYAKALQLKGTTLPGQVKTALLAPLATNTAFARAMPVRGSGSAREAYAQVLPPSQFLPSYEVCAPPAENINWYAGGGLGAKWGRGRNEEFNLLGMLTNAFGDSGGSFAGYIEAGVDVPINNNYFVGGTVIGTFTDLRVRHEFGGDNYFGSTTLWEVSILAKAGVGLAPDVSVAILGGATVARQSVDVRLGGPATDNSSTVWGPTIGVEATYVSPRLSAAVGRPVIIVGRYTHTWFGHAEDNQPISSPAFDYRTQVNQSAATIGLRVPFGGRVY